MSAFFHRILAILLLCLSAGTGEAAYANSSGECIHAAQNQQLCNGETVSEKQQHSPQDAVLSRTASIASAFSLPASSPNVSGGGPCVPSPLIFLFSEGKSESTIQLRRWRIMASAVRQIQLKGLHPQHAFW